MVAAPSNLPVDGSTNFTAVVVDGTAPYQYLWATLPTGCSGRDNSSLTCSPRGAGTFNVSVNVTDAVNGTVGAWVEVVVTPAPANVTNVLGSSSTGLPLLEIGAFGGLLVLGTIGVLLWYRRSGGRFPAGEPAPPDSEEGGDGVDGEPTDGPDEPFTE